MQPLIIAGLGATELLIILAVVVLLFGATKLPELARGSGRALRIFKSETKGLMDDDEGPAATTQPLAQPLAQPVAQPVTRPVTEPVSEPRTR
jgi:sec-independent protein translocase protein TatA